jgi:hypothetical protein
LNSDPLADLGEELLTLAQDGFHDSKILGKPIGEPANLPTNLTFGVYTHH